jgi:hypothetical protein
MARYKPYDLDQGKFIPVSFRDQILPGSFEYSLNEIVDEHVDLTAFEDRYANDDTGRRAYDPSVLLKIVLYGYYKGNRLQPKAGRGVRTQRHVHGAFGRYPPALHHDRRLHQSNAPGSHQCVYRRADVRQ